MSDYFTSLATRAVHAEGGLMPRPRTPFEPISHAPVDASAPAVAVEQVTEAEPVPEHEPPARRTRAAPRQGRRGTHAVTTEADAPPERDLASHFRPPARERQLIATRPHPTVRVVTAERGVASGPLREGVVRPVPSRQPAREEIARPSRPHPPNAERSAAPGTRVAPAMGDGSEPTIRIHIGRVEVRAMAPAAPPQRTPRGTSLMTLEDYVRQRKDGRS